MARYSKAFRSREEPSIARVYPDINTQRCALRIHVHVCFERLARALAACVLQR